MSKKSKVIYLMGAVDESMVEKFATESSQAKREGFKEILVHLNSEGGGAMDAIAISQTIRRLDIPVEIQGNGFVASAAVMILAAGTKGRRSMTRETWMMVHEEQVDGECLGCMSVSAWERTIAQYRRQEDQWCRMLETFTGTSFAEWAILHKDDTHLSAEECLELGIIDYIV